ncbi:MAG: hypothetical protein JO264_03250 [Acidisphaera sp.]|nr:hypothetical protein [Acidisphaera sp.]
MAYQHKRDPAIDTTPDPHQRQHIDLVDLKDILGKAVKDPALARKLTEKPEETLRSMNYEPHQGAVDFFKSLDATTFETAAKSFVPHTGGHRGSHTGMAEC